MKHFLRLATLLALFLLPSAANATNKFMVLCATTCTWDNTNDTIWSLSSNGANNTTHPVAGDVVTLDASSCSGGTTCTITVAANLAMTTLTMGTCTASTAGCILDFSVNNNSLTLFTLSVTGTGTRTLKCGSGTFHIGGASNAAVMDLTTLTNATITCGSVALSDENTANLASTWTLNGQTFGSFAASASTTPTGMNFTGNFTLNNAFTVTGGRNVQFTTSVTYTFTGGFVGTGTSTAPVYVVSNTSGTGAVTLSLGAASTCVWCVFKGVTTSGSAMTSTNSMNLSTVVSVGTNTITPSVAAGSGGGGIIGG